MVYDINAALLAGDRQRLLDRQNAQQYGLDRTKLADALRTSAVQREGLQAATAGQLLGNRITEDDFNRAARARSSFAAMLSDPKLQAIAQESPELLGKYQGYSQSEQLFPVKLEGEKLGNLQTKAQTSNIYDTIRSRKAGDARANQQLALQRQAAAMRQRIAQGQINEQQRQAALSQYQMLGNVGKAMLADPANAQANWPKTKQMLGAMGISNVPDQYDENWVKDSVQGLEIMQAAMGPQSRPFEKVGDELVYTDTMETAYRPSSAIEAEKVAPGYIKGDVDIPDVEAKAFRSALKGADSLKENAAKLRELIVESGTEFGKGATAKRMEAIRQQMIFNIKDKEQMGALQAPEIAMLEKLVPDPVSLGENIRTLNPFIDNKAAMLATLDTLVESTDASIQATANSMGLVGGAAGIPDGVDPADWQYMTPEQKALFK